RALELGYPSARKCRYLSPSSIIRTRPVSLRRYSGPFVRAKQLCLAGTWPFKKRARPFTTPAVISLALDEISRCQHELSGSLPKATIHLELTQTCPGRFSANKKCLPVSLGAFHPRNRPCLMGSRSSPVAFRFTGTEFSSALLGLAETVSIRTILSEHLAP